MATPEEITALEAKIAALNDMLASGARSVTLGGQTITYNTTQSLIVARNDAVQQLRRMKRSTRRSRQTYLYQNGRGTE